MLVPENFAVLSREELLRVIVAQQRQVAELAARVEALQAEVERLKREGQRRAAPFSKGTGVAAPKKPGRKPGQGPFTHRTASHPETLTEPPIEVPVRLTACPVCGGRLAAAGTELASLTDLPEAIRPCMRQFGVAVSRCTACGPRTRGQHPELAPDQAGATAHRVGARVMAHAHVLHYGIGVPLRKVPAILQQLLGVRITQSALTQDALRRAEGSGGGPLRSCGPRSRELQPGTPMIRAGGWGGSLRT